MKKILLVALAISLSGCVGSSTNWLAISQAVSQTITNSVPVACQSATAIASQASQAGLLKADKAATAADKIQSTCAKAQVGATALGIINTAAAVLLGIAGSNGITLPGLPGIK